MRNNQENHINYIIFLIILRLLIFITLLGIIYLTISYFYLFFNVINFNSDRFLLLGARSLRGIQQLYKYLK